MTDTDIEIHPADLEPSPFREGDDPAPRHAPTVGRVPIPASQAFDLSNIAAGLAKEPENPIPAGLLLQGIDDPAKGVHPFGGLCKACLQRRDDYYVECVAQGIEPTNPPLVTKLDVQWRQLDAKLAPGWFPVNCCESCYEYAKKDHSIEKANRELWERLCPPEFRDPYDPKKGDPKLWDRVMKFQMQDKRGLVIHGQSGAGKTFVVWKLLHKLAQTGISWLFIESIDLLDAIPNEAFTTQLLVIDDLGNDALTGAKEVRFLKLIRTRCNWRRPFIVTTQFNGELLTEKFSDSGTAQAVMRRMRQFCDSVHARAPGEGGIQRDANGKAVFS